jgi:hypothetical protein
MKRPNAEGLQYEKENNRHCISSPKQPSIKIKLTWILCVIVKFSLFKKIAGLPVDFSPLDCSQNLF